MAETLGVIGWIMVIGDLLGILYDLIYGEDK